MPEQLLIVCDACGRPIGDGDGYLHVDHAQIAAHRARRSGVAKALSVSELLALPDVARWQAHHNACYPDSEAVDYDVPVAKVRTWPKLTATTAELMAKTWLPSTDWSVLLDDAAAGRGRRVTRPLGAAA